MYGAFSQPKSPSSPQFIQAYLKRLGETLTLVQSRIDANQVEGGTGAGLKLAASDPLRDRLRFAIYQLSDYPMGWGNRIRGMLAVFLLALITDRIFLVHHEMLTTHFQSPFFSTFNGVNVHCILQLLASICICVCAMFFFFLNICRYACRISA